MNDVIKAFESEILRRGLGFGIEEGTGRYIISGLKDEKLVSLENLLKGVQSDGDLGRVSRFVDAIIASGNPGADFSKDRLYWALEPSAHFEKADFRVAVSTRVDRVLVHLSSDHRLITWVTPKMLESANLSHEEAFDAAFKNLARALSDSKIEFQEIDGVRLGFIAPAIPMKSSLILAPNLRQVVEATLGWPLQAVAPGRDFLYLWDARHEEFVERVGGVVVDEYSKASYPLSTEVYSITDEGVEALGAFPTS